MNELRGKLLQRYGFRQFRSSDRMLLDPYEQGSVFFDLSFTNFWAWEKTFHYVYRIVGDTFVVAYTGLDQTAYCTLLPGERRDLMDAVIFVRDIFQQENLPFAFEYIPEQWLELYRATGLPMEVSSDRDWSDYIYLMSEFMDIKGAGNKSKRRALTLFSKQGDADFQPLSLDNFDTAVEVFRRWCVWHDCRDCVFGCERRAFERLKEIWDKRYYGGVVCLDGEPVAFALAETLGDCACYSFQKNAGHIPGLTYFLHYHCAQLPGHPPRMNWCEDMGLEGLRANKLHFHPCAIVEKYTIQLNAR